MYLDIKKSSANTNISAEKSGVEDSNVEDTHCVGALLIEFLLFRKLITTNVDLNESETKRVNKKKGKYYFDKKLYAVCNKKFRIYMRSRNNKPIDIPSITNKVTNIPSITNKGTNIPSITNKPIDMNMRSSSNER